MSSLNYQTIGHRQLRPSSYFCQLHVGAGCQEWWGQGNAGKHLDLIVFGLHLRQMARPLRQRVRASNWRSRSWSSSSLRRPRYFLLNLSKIFHWCLSIYIAWHSNESGCHATAWFRVRREDHSCWHSTSKGPRFRLEDCLALRPFKGILSANYGWQPKSHWDLLRSVRRKRVARRKTEPQFLWAQRHFVLGGVCVPSSDLHLILHPETWVETKFLIQVSLEHAPVAPNLNSLLAGWEWLPQHGASFSNVFVAYKSKLVQGFGEPSQTLGWIHVWNPQAPHATRQVPEPTHCWVVFGCCAQCSHALCMLCNSLFLLTFQAYLRTGLIQMRK